MKKIYIIEKSVKKIWIIQKKIYFIPIYCVGHNTKSEGTISNTL